MMSDYELMVWRWVERGVVDTAEIARKTGLPEPIVRAALDRLTESGGANKVPDGDSRKIALSKNAARIAIDVLIIWVLIQLLSVVL